MGLFNFFNRKNGRSEIPEDVFIEKDKSSDDVTAESNGVPSGQNGINLLFQFLEKNYEGKGYDDALINPDITHLEQNKEALKNDFERTIRKVKTFYEDFIRETNFHISSQQEWYG